MVQRLNLLVMELFGLLAIVAAFGLVTAGGFMISVIAGVFTLAGLLLLSGIGLLLLAAYREAAARQNGQHASPAGDGRLRSAA